MRLEVVDHRRLAAVRRSSRPGRVGADIIAALDVVWPELRRQGVATGHNVVVYHGGPQRIVVGVEVAGPFTPTAELIESETPAGAVVATTYFGPYQEMAIAYNAIEAWRASSGRRLAGVSWEVYGDHSDDPAQLRTDIYFLLEPEDNARRGLP